MTKKLQKYLKWFFGIFAIVSLIYVLAIHFSYTGNEFHFDDASLEEWNTGWDIRYGNTIEENITLPTEVPIEKGEKVMLRKTLPGKIKKYNCIMLEGLRQDISVSIGGICRETYSDEDYRPWGTSSPSGFILVPLYNTDSLEDVTIHISSNSYLSGKISAVYIGNEKSLVVMMLKLNMSWLFIDVIVLILGISSIVSFYTYASNYKISKGMIHLAFFAIFSAMWGFAQSGIRQFFVDDLTILEAVGYGCYMLIPISLASYIDWIMERRYEKVIKIYVVISAINFVIENILQWTLKVGFFELRYVTQTIIMVGICGAMVLCLFEMNREFNSMVRLLTVGIIGLLLGVLTEISFFHVRFAGEGYNRYIGGAFIFTFVGFIYNAMCASKEQKLIKDAESANRAKNMLLASVSHEIMTPINAVIGMNEMIIRDSSEDSIREYASNIDEASRTLVGLVNELLDFSKIESGELDIIDSEYEMKPLLKEILSSFESKINSKGLKLIVDIDENIPSKYLGDGKRIKQIIMQLLSNAVKYTEQGSVTLSIRNNSENDDIASIYVGVKDTGEGIKQEDIAKLHESFARVEKVKDSDISGLGLGLTISTKLLGMMGTVLEVESVYGEGSNFFFTLDQRIIDKTPMGPLKAKSERAERKRKINFIAPDARILAVDDNKMNLTVLKGILKSAKMQVDTCESGMKCLEMCKDKKYDLIFMDHMMPEMDGVETFKNLRTNRELMSTDSVVAVLTANTVTGADEYYKACGFDYYMKKPIDVSELNNVLRQYIPQNLIMPLEGA